MEVKFETRVIFVSFNHTFRPSHLLLSIPTLLPWLLSLLGFLKFFLRVIIILLLHQMNLYIATQVNIINVVNQAEESTEVNGSQSQQTSKVNIIDEEVRFAPKQWYFPPFSSDLN